MDICTLLVIYAFEKYVSSTITEDQLIPVIEIDAVLEFEQITNKFYTILKQFAPFGPMNMRPVFQSDNVVLAAPVRIVGENHLKVVLKSKDGKSKMEAIGFKMAHFADKILEEYSIIIEGY